MGYQLPATSYKLKGFTLIEAIVYLAIASIILVIITQIFISQSQIYDTETSRVDIDLYAKQALNRIVTNSVSALGVVATQAISGDTYTASSSTLILKLPAIDLNQNLISNKYDYVVFYLEPTDQTKLYLKMDADPSSSRQDAATLLATFVESLNFRYNMPVIAEANKVEISLNLARVTRGQKHTAQSSTAIFFKNKF